MQAMAPLLDTVSLGLMFYVLFTDKYKKPEAKEMGRGSAMVDGGLLGGCGCVDLDGHVSLVYRGWLWDDQRRTGSVFCADVPIDSGADKPEKDCEHGRARQI